MDFKYQKFEELLSEHHALRATGELYEAMLRLALAEYLAKRLSASDKAMLEDCIKRIDLTAEERTKVVAKAKAEYQKLLRLFYAIDTLTVEEMYLIVSLRINLGLLSQFLLAQHWHIDLDIPLNKIDEQIRAVQSTPKLTMLFNKVVKSVHKNSGILLHDSSVKEFLH